MPVQDIQKVLPAWNAQGDNSYAHLTNERLNREVAYCGYRDKGAHEECGKYDGHSGRCNCGTPVCPSCLQVRNSYHRSGAWEGPDERHG